MEKYIDKSSIISLEVHEEEVMYKLYTVYKKPWKLFGLIPIGKEEYVIQTFPKYHCDAPYYYSNEEAFNIKSGFDKHQYILKDNIVYRRAYVRMHSKQGNEYVKYFDDEKEIDEYIKSLDLDIVKNYVKLKIDY